MSHLTVLMAFLREDFSSICFFNYIHVSAVCGCVRVSAGAAGQNKVLHGAQMPDVSTRSEPRPP